jgi:hypothetical protein
VIVLEARSWDGRDGRFHRWLDQLSPIAELVTLHDRPWNQHATWMRADNLRRDGVSRSCSSVASGPDSAVEVAP